MTSDSSSLTSFGASLSSQDASKVTSTSSLRSFYEAALEAHRNGGVPDHVSMVVVNAPTIDEVQLRNCILEGLMGLPPRALFYLQAGESPDGFSYNFEAVSDEGPSRVAFIIFYEGRGLTTMSAVLPESASGISGASASSGSGPVFLSVSSAYV